MSNRAVHAGRANRNLNRRLKGKRNLTKVVPQGLFLNLPKQVAGVAAIMLC
jgi:hypothetical protein